MPTIRGFPERLEIGRAGLVTVTLLHDDGTRASYFLPDLDADPERFNERLSKLALLRDAQNRAEPVEVEYEDGEGGRTIERVARITRDAHDPPGATDTVRVMIVGVAVFTQNQTGLQAEAADTAEVFTLAENGAGRLYTLNLQVPERGVAEAQLELIRTAQASGETITLLVDTKTRRITGVGTGEGASGGGSGGELETIDGFVESIAHASTAGGLAGTALVEFTTAPPFTGAAQVVALVPFVPGLRTFLVVLGSPEYELFLTGLRKKLRMRVSATTPRRGGTDDDGLDHPTGGNPSADTPTTGLRVNFRAMAAAGTGGDPKNVLSLVRGAKLLHALVSASRPVWVQISRKSLDVGPDAACTDGLPSNDLTPRGLRDLHIPYTAEWIGWGCFNHGVYRFQFDLKTPLKIYVDGKLLCVHASEDGATQFAHACLDCEHEVRVVLTDWTCEQDFLMDVYRIR
jgi:hypothetical protein